MDSVSYKYAEQLPNSLFAENRKKFLQMLRDFSPEVPKGALILMKSKWPVPIDSTDIDYDSFQESNFYYLFGVQEFKFYACIELDTGKTTLFAPNTPITERIFMCPPRKAEIEKKYGLPTMYQSKLEAFVESLKPVRNICELTEQSVIYLCAGINQGSRKVVEPPMLPWFSRFKIDTQEVYPILYNCRIRKTPEELEVMRSAIEAAAEGHLELMRKCKPGMRESYLAAIYRHQGLFNYNVKFKPYPDIMASGPNAATLHYDINSRVIQPGELVLCDCAHRVCGYCSDITTTFPSTGKFTEKQKQIYEIVLGINRKIQGMLKPGVKWMDMERLCSQMLLEGLKTLGLVKGDIKEMLEKDVNSLFMPHSLGHFLGLDAHDVGMDVLYSPPGVLEAGMIVTVEPGCYFIEMMFARGAQAWNIPLTYVDMDKARDEQLTDR